MEWDENGVFYFIRTGGNMYLAFVDGSLFWPGASLRLKV